MVILICGRAFISLLILFSDMDISSPLSHA
jgi:hypothetical protein